MHPVLSQERQDSLQSKHVLLSLYVLLGQFSKQLPLYKKGTEFLQVKHFCSEELKDFSKQVSQAE